MLPFHLQSLQFHFVSHHIKLMNQRETLESASQKVAKMISLLLLTYNQRKQAQLKVVNMNCTYLFENVFIPSSE